MTLKSSFFICTLTSVLLLCAQLFAQTTLSTVAINETTRQVSLALKLKPKDFIVKNSIDISVDHPDITLSSWHMDRDPVERYEPTLKSTKKLFDKNFTITLNATAQKPFAQLTKACLYLSYYLGSKKKTVQEVLPLTTQTCPVEQTATLSAPADEVEELVETLESAPTEKKELSFSERLSHLVETTETLWIRIALVLLLGLLMSLTPCIYPMIPITLGILQSRGSKSIVSNFLQSLLYTCGIATTFAVLGVIAAFTGQVFGKIMTNPFFVVALSVLLAYLGLSMFGLYEMYTPRFMRKGVDTGAAKKSLLSIFLFGAASGTVASPCLSPGLILLLSIVTAMGSKILGFVLLFAFGFGLGIPLLIIGTFSSSLNALPRAGMWMVEIKKIFGFMLFGMVFYFLSAVIPFNIVLGLMTLFMLAASVAYFYSIKPTNSNAVRTIKNLIGVMCAALAVFLAIKTYQATFYTQQNHDALGDHEANIRIWQEKKKYYDEYVKLQPRQIKNEKREIDQHLRTVKNLGKSPYTYSIAVHELEKTLSYALQRIEQPDVYNKLQVERDKKVMAHAEKRLRKQHRKFSQKKHKGFSNGFVRYVASNVHVWRTLYGAASGTTHFFGGLIDGQGTGGSFLRGLLGGLWGSFCSNPPNLPKKFYYHGSGHTNYWRDCDDRYHEMKEDKKYEFKKTKPSLLTSFGPTVVFAGGGLAAGGTKDLPKTILRNTGGFLAAVINGFVLKPLENQWRNEAYQAWKHKTNMARWNWCVTIVQKNWGLQITEGQ